MSAVVGIEVAAVGAARPLAAVVVAGLDSAPKLRRDRRLLRPTLSGSPFDSAIVIAVASEGLVGELEQRLDAVRAWRLERLRSSSSFRLLLPSPLANALGRGLERLDEDRAVLGGKPRLQDERAVVVPEVRHVLELVLPSGLGGADALVDAQRPPTGRRPAQPPVSVAVLRTQGSRHG